MVFLVQAEIIQDGIRFGTDFIKFDFVTNNLIVARD
jgi:hypothetical protein